MSLLKSDRFVSDVERQYEWYVVHASSKIADRYIHDVEGTCRLLEQHPLLGPQAGLTHPRLRAWRFFAMLRPFNKHVIFYEVLANDVVMRRAMHGQRDLPRRLLQGPGAA